MAEKNLAEKKQSERPHLLILANNAHSLIVRPATTKEVEGTLVSIPSIVLNFTFQKRMLWDSAADGKHLTDRELEFVHESIQARIDAGQIEYRFLDPETLNVAEEVQDNEKNITPIRRPQHGVKQGYRTTKK